MSLQLLLLLEQLGVKGVFKGQSEGAMAPFVQVVRFALSPLKLDVVAFLELALGV